MALNRKYFKIGEFVWYNKALAKVLRCGLLSMTIELLSEPMEIELSFRNTTNIRIATKAEVVLYASKV